MKISTFSLTRMAEQDLRSIWQYIAQDNPSAAKKLIDDLFISMNRLADFPEMGCKREEITKRPVRFLVVRKYIIVYTNETKPMTIIRVLSGYQDIRHYFN